MSKYNLIASNYDSYSNSYKNEIVIKELDSKKLSSLIRIDMFTSSHSREEILTLIEKEYGIKNINNLSIRFKKWNSDEFEYLRVIVDDKKFLDCILSVDKVSKIILDKPRDTDFISSNNELFKEELRKLFAMIEDGSFNNYYLRNNELTKLVNMYNNSKSSNEEELYERNKILRFLSSEFSRYKTFRGWYVLGNKVRGRNVGINQNANNLGVAKNKKKNEKIMSIEENIEVYDKLYKKEHGSTYDDDKLMEYNLDNEEFLDIEDYKEMFDYDNSRVVRRRR